MNEERERERFGEKKEEEETNCIYITYKKGELKEIKVCVKGQRKELSRLEERDSGRKKFAGEIIENYS